ncbi:hypothetical protein GCM10027215_22220 [Nocardioides zeae]
MEIHVTKGSSRCYSHPRKGVVMGTGLIGTLVSLVVGGTVAAVSVVGVVSSQTSAPSTSPGDSQAPAASVIDYGSN